MAMSMVFCLVLVERLGQEKVNSFLKCFYAQENKLLFLPWCKVPNVLTCLQVAHQFLGEWRALSGTQHGFDSQHTGTQQRQKWGEVHAEPTSLLPSHFIDRPSKQTPGWLVKEVDWHPQYWIYCFWPASQPISPCPWINVNSYIRIPIHQSPKLITRCNGLSVTLVLA